ncbi:hypothetical protein Tco_0757283 [Tanacetum coccineum]
MFFEGIDQRIPFTMTAMHKGVVYLNQYNIKSLMKLSEVKNFCDGTLMKIQENLIDMLSKNKLGSGNKRLTGRDWTDYDVKSSKEMLKKIDEGSYSLLDTGTCKSKPLPRGKPTDPKDSEGNKHLADMGLPATDDLKEDSEEDVFEAGEEMDEEIQEVVEDTWEKHEEVAASYANLKWGLKDFINISFTKYENTDVALRNFQQILNIFKTDHNTGLRRILKNLKEVQDAVKEDPALNKKVLEATEAYTKNSTNLIELLTLVTTFDFSGLRSIVESLNADMDTQNDHLAKWANPLPQAVCPKQHLLSLKVQQLLGENLTHTAIKETPSYIEGENVDMDTKEVVKKEPTKEPESPPKLVKASSEVCPDLDEPVRIAAEEAKLLEITKPELIKVIQEEATKAGVDPKILASAKGGQEKRKHQELKPEIRILGLEFYRSIPKDVPFFNNMVIEEPEYGMFFIDVFGN